MRLAQSDWPIIIVGGGIGGLAAALALGLNGRPVRVLEREPVFSAIGYGIQLGPNVFPMLRILGVEQEVLARARQPTAVSMCDALDGRTLATIPTQEAVIGRFGHPYAVIIRSELHKILLEACQRVSCISLEVNSTFESASERTDTGIDVQLLDGRREQAAGLVGAEGLRSKLRVAIHGDDQPSFTGYVAHRTIFPVEDLPSGLYRDDVVLWAGPNFHIVHYPLSDKLFNVVAVFRTSTYRDRLDPVTQRAEMIDAAADALPCLKAIIARMNLDRRWTLTDRPPVRQWSRGRTVLLGDAAHPTLQSIAQGACMAIEDGVTLANEVCRSPTNLADAFARYAKERSLRTARVQLVSREMWEVFHVVGVARDVRNATYTERTSEDYFRCLQWLWQGVQFETVC